MLYWTAISLGLLGGLHCVGMCGPLVLSLPLGTGGRGGAVSRTLVYHSGRLLSYAAVGFIVGTLGWGIGLASAQSKLSIASGSLLLLIALLNLNVGERLLQSRVFGRWHLLLRRRFSGLLQGGGLRSILGLGVLNGLLPCGLVYLAIFGAVNTGNAAGGAFYMLLFGMGTFPWLALVGLGGRDLLKRLRLDLRRSSAVLTAAAGIWLIWRGIHFLLPEDFYFWEATQFAPMCH